MSGGARRSSGAQRRQGRLVPARESAGLQAPDPLVRALAVCIRQAHARRTRGGSLDSAG
jgi:hypothetical protein